MVVAMPAVGARSLIACGMPCSQPMDSPRCNWASRSAARFSRLLVSTRLTMALTTGLTTSMRSSVACMTSTQDTWRRWMAVDSSDAVQEVMAWLGMLTILHECHMLLSHLKVTVYMLLSGVVVFALPFDANPSVPNPQFL